MAIGGPGRFLHDQGGPDRGGDHFPVRPADPWPAINRLSRPLRRRSIIRWPNVINESGWPDTRRGLPTTVAGFCRQSAAVFPARGVFSFRSGDWGELCEDDKLENEKAVRLRDRRIFSAYYLSDGTKIWVITERDFSATTILLPEEY